MVRVYIWLILLLLSHLVWTLLRRIFTTFQMVLWKLNGTKSQIQRNNQASSYKGSVQVMNVVCRYKYDLMGQPSGSTNFIASQKGFVDPEYVLQDHISLFYVNKDKAIWVEVDKGVDPARCEYSAFIYLAQYKLAKRLLIMPIHVFNKLGQKVGKPKAKMIFLTNTARCGSTLVSRAFAETTTCLAYSEPDCLNAITMLRGVVSDAERNTIFTNCINLLCKPLHSRQIQAYVLKPTQPTMVELPHIRKLYPDAYHLFLYRDGLAVSKSVAKCADGVPIVAMMNILGRWSAKMTKQIVEQMGLYSGQFEEKLKSDIHWGAIMWAAAIRHYLDFREQGIEIAAARYEDIIQDPNFAFRKIFEYCDVPFDSKAVEIAMSEDSQRGSPISHEKLKNYKPDDLTDEVKILTDKICDQFDVPRLPEIYVAPGTITTINTS